MIDAAFDDGREADGVLEVAPGALRLELHRCKYLGPGAARPSSASHPLIPAAHSSKALGRQDVDDGGAFTYQRS